MRNWFGTATLIVIMIGSAAQIIHGFWRSHKEKDWSPGAAAEISLGLAFILMVGPSAFYPDLAEDVQSKMLWLSAGLIALSALFAILAARARRIH